MNQLVVALKEYRRDHHRYPPKPYYDKDRVRPDGGQGMYIGGFSALYPDYVDSWDALVCPSDRAIDQKQPEARQRRYSSYNGVADDPASDKWDLVYAAYNYFGYDDEGWDSYDQSTCEAPENGDPLPTWLSSEGKGWKHYPRLGNRNAPDNTIATHCTNHRGFYHDEKDEKDPIIRLSGDADTITVSQWQDTEGGAKPSLFKTQQQ